MLPDTLEAAINDIRGAAALLELAAERIKGIERYQMADMVDELGRAVGALAHQMATAHHNDEEPLQGQT